MTNLFSVPTAFAKNLFSAAAIPAIFTVATFVNATSADAATYYVDFTLADEVYDFDTETTVTGSDTVHLTGEVVTSGFGTLADVMLSWSFTMKDQNTTTTISSEGLLAGTEGLVETVGMAGLSATATGLFSIYNSWGFQETVREPDDYYVGFVSNNFGDLFVQDIRQYSGPRTGAYAKQYDVFTSTDPVLFGSTTAPVDPDTISAVPVPASLPMLIAGLGVFGFMRGRRKHA